MNVKFKKNDAGEIVMTEEQFTEAMTEMSKATKDALVKEYQLDKVPALHIPAPEEQKKLEVEKLQYGPADEHMPERKKRIERAVLEIKGGSLAVEKAPKEIKMMRFCKALIDKDTVTVKALSEGSATDGGNLVPIEFGTDLKVAIEEYVAIQDCDQHLNMTTNELDLRSVTTKPLIYQVGEAVAVTEAGTKFGKPQLINKAWAGLQVMSKELFQDNNVGLYDKLVTLFAEGFNAKMSYELFQGSVYGGILGQATLQKTSLASTSIKDIDYQSLVNMSNSLSQGQLAKGGKWYMHRVIWGYCQGIVDKNGRPIVLNPWDARNRTMLGYPVVLDEQCPYTDAANTGFITFGNLQWVDFGMRQEVTAQFLTEGTVATVNLAEKRSVGLIIDTRWGIVVSLPANIAGLFTAAQ